MKKILILGSKEYPLGINKGYDLPSGGMEEYVENLVEYLKKDFDITIISAWFPGAKKYEMKGEIKIHRVKRIPGKIIRGITFPLVSFFKAFPMDFDIIISNGPVASFFAYLLSKMKNKKYIAIPHGVPSGHKEISGLIRAILKISEKKSFQNAHATVFLNQQEYKKYSERMKFKNEKFIEQGVNFERFGKIKRIKHTGKNILFMGRLVPFKSVETLIEALPFIQKDYNCIIVGDGPEKEKLEKLAKELKVKIKFTGYVTESEKEKYLGLADIFVSPSLSEGFPIAFLEVMSAKIPMIITKIGLPLTEKQVLLVDTKNPKQIAEAINKLLRDEPLRKKLVTNSYEYAKQHSFQNVAKEYKKLITELIGK